MVNFFALSDFTSGAILRKGVLVPCQIRVTDRFLTGEIFISSPGFKFSKTNFGVFLKRNYK
jgi:hypothetical protein